MFIERGIHQTQQSPSGATCDNVIRNTEGIFNATTRRGRKRENREETLPYLAPEGRYVYSRATHKCLKAPEGRHVYRTRHALVTKAPEGRHVIT